MAWMECLFRNSTACLIIDVLDGDSSYQPSDVADGLKVRIDAKKNLHISQVIDFSLKFTTFNKKNVFSLSILWYFYLVEIFSLVLALSPSLIVVGRAMDSLLWIFIPPSNMCPIFKLTTHTTHYHKPQTSMCMTIGQTFLDYKKG